MGHSRHDDEPRERRRERKRERTARERARREAEALEDSLLPPAERALRQAERQAEAKVELTEEVVKFSVVTVLLLIFVWPVGLFMLFFGGARHFRSFHHLVLSPRLREKYLHREVDKRVHAHLSGERQELESVHAHSMQELSARVAHEIRNPITAAKSLVQQMEEEPGAPENVEYARVALEELSRVERSVSHLLRFARDEEMRMGVVPLADVVDSALETFRERAARKPRAIEREIDAAGEIRGDAEKLRRVVINLVTNALDAIDGGRRGSGRVSVRRRREPGRHRGVAARRRRRPRPRRRGAAPDLEPVLHLEGRRHRPRPPDLQEAGRGARRHARGRAPRPAPAPSSSRSSRSAARKEGSREAAHPGRRRRARDPAGALGPARARRLRGRARGHGRRGDRAARRERVRPGAHRPGARPGPHPASTCCARPSACARRRWW